MDSCPRLGFISTVDGSVQRRHELHLPRQEMLNIVHAKSGWIESGPSCITDNPTAASFTMIMSSTIYTILPSLPSLLQNS